MQAGSNSGQRQNVIALIAMATVLSGCLMSEEKPKDEGDVLAQNQITGSVGDGPIVGATLRVMRNDGEVIANADSNGSAVFNAFVQPPASSYPRASIVSG